MTSRLRLGRSVDDLAEEIDYAVVGPVDGRTHVHRTRRFPFNTICYLGRDFGTGEWSGCSGVLTGPNTVLTAGHCIYSHKRGGPPRQIRVSAGRADRVTFPYGTIVSRRYYVPRAFVSKGLPSGQSRADFDYGVIVLPRPFPGLRRFMPLRPATAALVARLRRSGLIHIAGYPGDRPIGTLWRHTERLRNATARRLLYTVDTCPGHSGSPIWTRQPGDGRQIIIGIHTSGILDERGRSHGCSRFATLAPPGRMNRGVRLTPEVIDHVRHPARTVHGAVAMMRLP